jgi:hypothetical protein
LADAERKKKPEVGGGDGENESEPYPFNPDEYSSVYVSTGGDDENNGLSEDAPFATLAKAVTTVGSGDTYRRIVVLTNLVESGAVTINTAMENPVTIEGREFNLKIERAEGIDDSVIIIKGGAKINFKNIFINGDRSTAVYHRALDIGGTGTGTLVTLEDGAKITGKKSSSHAPGNTEQHGTGILVRAGAKLVMNAGSSVVNCRKVGEHAGGAVFLYMGGKFEMNEGAAITGSDLRHAGGVQLYSANGATGDTRSEFVMKGGTISDNITANGAGAVLVENSDFTMEGGMLDHNTTSSSGGGVYVQTGGHFTMKGGKISRNTAGSGGGVYVNGNSDTTKFSLEGGVICGGTQGYSAETNIANSGTGAVLTIASGSNNKSTFHPESLKTNPATGDTLVGEGPPAT